jgi:uncharacterized protein (TIGR03000 family)
MPQPFASLLGKTPLILLSIALLSCPQALGHGGGGGGGHGGGGGGHGGGGHGGGGYHGGYGGGGYHAGYGGAYHGGYGGAYHGGAYYHGGGYYHGYYGPHGFYGPYHGYGFYRPYGYGFYRPYYGFGGIGFGYGYGYGLPYYGSGYGLGFGFGPGFGGLGMYGSYFPTYTAGPAVALPSVAVPGDAVPGGAAPGALPPGAVPPTPDGSQPPPDNAVHLQLVVPENAQVFFDGSQVVQTGTIREFVSPPLPAGKTFTYKVSVRYRDAAGKPVDDTRDIQVRANDWFRIDFTQPAPQQQAPAPRPLP